MDAIVMFLDAVISGFSWFTQVFTAAGLLDIFSGLMIISLIMFRHVSPLLRSAGSDRARRSSGKDDSNE